MTATAAAAMVRAETDLGAAAAVLAATPLAARAMPKAVLAVATVRAMEMAVGEAVDDLGREEAAVTARVTISSEEAVDSWARAVVAVTAPVVAGLAVVAVEAAAVAAA